MRKFAPSRAVASSQSVSPESTILRVPKPIQFFRPMFTQRLPIDLGPSVLRPPTTEAGCLMGSGLPLKAEARSRVVKAY